MFWSGISKVASTLWMTGLLVVVTTSNVAGVNAPRPAIACQADAARFCSVAQYDDARRVACLNQHHVSLSLACRRALAAAKRSA